jgi:protocatechuate 3,4-dioxygenase beta subunit
MKLITLTAVFILFLQLAGCSQNDSKTKSTTANNKQTKTDSKRIGGGCEGCEAIYESTVPFEKLNEIDTLPDFNDSGPKIRISGTVYQSDGKTPAKDVVIYVYHTDQTGRYSSKGSEAGWGKRHGSIRGWLKTNANGFYQFYTLKPASYPNSNIPKHIHITVKEPDKNEYYIDEYLFDDDPFLTQSERDKQEGRGGTGIIKLLMQSNGLLEGTRNVVLGKNIPDYPTH